VKQIPIKFGGIYVIKMNLEQTVLSTSTPNIGGPIHRRSLVKTFPLNVRIVFYHSHICC